MKVSVCFQILFVVGCANIFGALSQSYVQCGTGTGENNLCRTDFPICCVGFCATAGDKCCPNVDGAPTAHTCDPGQECCSKLDEFGLTQMCCSAGSYCAGQLLGCVVDTCASITDPGVCVSQYNATANQQTENSQCSWCCDNQICVSSAAAKSICGSTISNPWSQCADPCSRFGTCDECTTTPTCLWDSSSQQCFISGQSYNYNPFAVVSTPDTCASILYWGTGITAAQSPTDIFGSSSKIVFIVFGVLFIICLLAICISGARVAILVNRTTQDWEAEREERAQDITAAVPRYGFAEQEEEDSKSAKEKKKSRKKNFRTPAVRAREDSESDNNNAAEQEDDTLCHLCRGHTQHQSRRTFLTVGDASERSPSSMEKAAVWNQIVLLPCYHRICKDCVYKRAHANAAAAGGYGSATMRMISSMFSRVNPFAAKKTAAATTTSSTNSQRSVEDSQTAINGTSTQHRTKPRAADDTNASIISLSTRPPSTEDESRRAPVAPAREGDGTEATVGPDAPLLDKKKKESQPKHMTVDESIHAVLDSPDVEEDALLDIFAGTTIASHLQKKRDLAAEGHKDTPSSSDSETEGHRNRKSGKVLPLAAASKCPVCDSTIEIVFVPGKVLR